MTFEEARAEVLRDHAHGNEECRRCAAMVDELAQARVALSTIRPTLPRGWTLVVCRKNTTNIYAAENRGKGVAVDGPTDWQAIANARAYEAGADVKTWSIR